MEPEPAVIKELLADLRSFDKDRRRLAVMKLGMVGGEDAFRALLMTVRNDHEDLVTRGKAALMLGRLRDVRAVDTLIKALESPGYSTRVSAAEALGNIGDRRAIAPLMKLLAASNDTLARAAQDALHKLGHVQQAEAPQPEATPEIAG